MLMNLEERMKATPLCVIVCLALGTLSCGRSSGPETSTPAGRTGEKPGASRAAKNASATPGAAVDAGILRLSAVELSPANPVASTDLNARPVVAEPAPEGVDFQYRWFVNDKLVTNAETADLSCANFSKKQWVYCEARAITGERESEWLFSKRVRIANTPPQLSAAEPGEVSVPGEFTYQIAASDPDKDPLTYELVSPLDEGIELDARTGLLTWKIDGETVQRLGQQIEIKFAVSDDDAGKTSGSITLDLAPAKR
jgi:hypothetical protein